MGKIDRTIQEHCKKTDFSGETMEQLLLRRVFKAIIEHDLTDHKMTKNYVKGVIFDRQLGHDICKYIKKRYPKYYAKIEKYWIEIQHGPDCIS